MHSTKSRVDQARHKFHQQSILKPSWNKQITQAKASTEVMIKEQEQRRKSSSTSKSKESSGTIKMNHDQSSPEVKIFKIAKDNNKSGKDGVKFIDEVGLSMAEKYRNRVERDKKVQRNYIPTTRTVRKLMEQGFGGKLLPDVATDSDCDDVTSLGSSNR